jgi:hypothetical protein
MRFGVRVTAAGITYTQCLGCYEYFAPGVEHPYAECLARSEWQRQATEEKRPNDVCQRCGHHRERHVNGNGACCAAVWDTHWHLCECGGFVEKETE